jgi:fatty acid desaturase
MSTPTATPKADTPRPHRRRRGTRIARRLAWIIGYAAIRGAAATAGGAAVTALLWWLQSR